MTRARALTVEPEVNSFLFEFHSDSHESRILPQMETLCTLRYQEEAREEARTEMQEPMEEEIEEACSRREAKEVPDYLGCPATSYSRLGEPLAAPSARPLPGAGLGHPGCPAIWPRVPNPLPGRRPRVPGPSPPGARPPLGRGPAPHRVPGLSTPGCSALYSAPAKAP